MLKNHMEVRIPPPPVQDLEHVLQCAEATWRTLRGARLFVSGGTGFFGRWLLESIAFANERLQADIAVAVLTRAPASFRARAPQLAAQPFFEWIAGDVRDFTFPPGTWTHIVHGAASTSATMNSERPADMLDTIRRGTQRMLEFATRSGASDFLLLSSGAVYGRQPSELESIPETFFGAPTPGDAYGIGKRDAEAVCLGAARPGLAVKIARGFAFVGPYLPLDAHFAVGNFLRDVLLGHTISVRGDGTPRRSYLHAADLIVWLLTILVRGESGRPYNVGSDEAVSIADLGRRVAALAPHALAVEVHGAPNGALPERYVPSIDRARRELGLEPRIGLDEALRRTYLWHKAQCA